MISIVHSNHHCSSSNTSICSDCLFRSLHYYSNHVDSRWSAWIIYPLMCWAHTRRKSESLVFRPSKFRILQNRTGFQLCHCVRTTWARASCRITVHAYAGIYIYGIYIYIQDMTDRVPACMVWCMDRARESPRIYVHASMYVSICLNIWSNQDRRVWVRPSFSVFNSISAQWLPYAHTSCPISCVCMYSQSLHGKNI